MGAERIYKGLMSFLDSNVPEINVPVMEPVQYVRPEPAQADEVNSEMSGWYDWLVHHVPKTIKRNVSSVFKTMKEKIMGLYNTPTPDPVLVKSGVKGKVEKWRVDGEGYKDPRVFLNNTRAGVERTINSVERTKKASIALTCQMVRSDPKTGEDTYTAAHFRSTTHQIITPEDTTEHYGEMVEKVLENFAKFQKRGSGWRLHSIDDLAINITKFKPLKGKGYAPLPKKLKDKKAIINMKNIDEECFKWAVTRALNPVKRNAERVSKILMKQAEKLNWDGLEYPVKLTNIIKFEKNNDVGVNVFSCDDDKKYTVYPLRLTKSNAETIVNLFLWGNHYSVVKDLSRFASSQINSNEHAKHICDRCMNAFGSIERLGKHMELCLNHEHQRHEYPKVTKEGNVPTTKFENVEKLHTVPFVVYADFECYIEGLENTEKGLDQSSTTQYQKHNPSGFCYYIKCFDDSIYKPKLVHYTQQVEGEDVSKKFVEMLEEDARNIYESFKEVVPIRMTTADTVDFENTSECYACRRGFTEENYKVRDHCHYTGKYRGAAHNKCNLKMKRPKFIPVLFHNLEGYDSHLFVKNLGVSEGDIKCIPKNEEKYISFSKVLTVGEYEDREGNIKPITTDIRFIDSLKFTLSSLEKLAKNLGDEDFKNLSRAAGVEGYNEEQTSLLRQKGVFPYEYVDSFERLAETKLPPKEAFYSKLTDSHISDEDYKHAQTVWKTFEMKTMRDYHDLYLKTDVLLLADIMENFRNICKTNYGLDPMWYYTSPGLAWDAALKKTGVCLDLITYPNMYLMVENGIRGGISTITKRYAESNNKYMTNYDPEKDDKYIEYLDANNLYGWAMTQPLPVGEFRWMEEGELADWRNISNTKGLGCILEVDLEYPEKLHDLHNEYPVAPERLTVGKVEKLIPNLNGKTKYVIHHENLKQYLGLGLKLTKIHRGIRFREEPWLKSYIQLNTDLRTKGTTEFEKDFFKLMNNSVFGKTMENVRNRVDIRLVTSEDQFEKLASKPNYKSFTIFQDGGLTAVHMYKTTVKLCKPIYLGMSILDLDLDQLRGRFYGSF